MLDLAVIGSGPAALTAALYAARSGLKVEVFEKGRLGGTLPEISYLANFPGFDGQGSDLAQQLLNQAKSAGVKISYGTCSSLSPLIIDDEKVAAKTVIIATGSSPRSLKFALNVPVSYCAICDGDLYKGKNLCVVGGGNSAVGEAIHLAKIAKSVTVLSHSTLKAQPVLIKALKTFKNVKILENVEPTPEKLNTFDAVFVLIGKVPATDFVPKSLLDEFGYIKTNDEYTTSLEGVFAAGDVRSGSLKQAIAAAGEGAAAATAATNFLATKN